MTVSVLQAAVEPGASGVVFLLARVLFGGVLAFNGLNHFTNREMMAGYAEAKGTPAPGAAVVVSGLMLLLGGLGIVLGVFPTLSAAAVAIFLVVSALLIHDFWAVPEDQQQDEMTQFLKNVGLTGGALAFLVAGGAEWAYAINVGLFL